MRVNEKNIPFVVSVSVFLISQENIDVKMCEDEISEYQWLPLSYFIFEEGIKTYSRQNHVTYTLSPVMGTSQEEIQ